MILIDDDMSKVTEREVKRLFQTVDAQRQEEALRYRHMFGQYCCLRSWEMLRELLQRLGIEHMGEWRYNEYRKPYLKEGPYFSISHCKNAIAVAVYEQEVGIDIESIRKADEALVERTMNRVEQEQIARVASADEAFTALWTRKEAVLKMRGTGILDDLHEVLNQSPEDYTLETNMRTDKGYVYSVAVRQL